MGNNLFGANISGQLAGIMGPLLGAKAKAVYSKRVAGVRNASDPSDGRAMVAGTPYPCVAIIETKARLLPRSRVKAGDSIISILGDTLNGGATEPEVNGEITLNGKTYTINDLMADPDKAMWECACRGG